MSLKPPNIFGDKLFEIEHALNIFAYSYVYFPAAELYNKELLAQHSLTIAKCHVYLIGYVPTITLVSAEAHSGSLLTNFEVGGQKRDLRWDMPTGGQFRRSGDAFWVELEDGRRVFPSSEESMLRLHRAEPIPFDVQYIGQAYGANGDRNALDRLIKHETLQRIALAPPPTGKRLEIVLLELQPGNKIFQVINPWADQRDDDGSRTANALDSLYDTEESHRVSLYEAAMIRYFQPKYNKEFKDSFPSTNLKVLSECYAKDMAGIVAEFIFDDLPFFLQSKTIPMQPYHIVGYNIHGVNERDIFFGRKSGNLTIL